MPPIDLQTLHNPTPGQPIPSSWGDGARDNFEFLARNKPHCRAFNNANINVNSATATAMTFNSERFDIGGCHSTVSQTSRLTVPTGEGAKYLMGSNLSWAVSAASYRQSALRVNGTTLIAVDSRPPRGDGFCIMPLSTDYPLAAGDYIEVIAEQATGGGLNVVAAGNYSPEAWLLWVGL